MNPSEPSSLSSGVRAATTVPSVVAQASGATAPFQFGPVQPRFAPSWAERFGEDREGIFAECVLQSVLFQWRWIPPGRFWMGAAENEKPDFEAERPRHEVILSHGFWMGRTPVTQAQWVAVMKGNPSNFRGDLLPVENVSWEDAKAFCARLNVECPGLAATLPSEAQWEYACRAGTTGAFGDGSACTVLIGKDPAMERLGWFDENAGGTTHPVGLKDCNAWGLHDMHGNVWEWCRDGLRAFRGQIEINPDMPDIEMGAVIRGGSWDDTPAWCRCACRVTWLAGRPRDDLGFRLVAVARPWGAEPP